MLAAIVGQVNECRGVGGAYTDSLAEHRQGDKEQRDPTEHKLIQLSSKRAIFANW
jgi:hypothetical protein